MKKKPYNKLIQVSVNVLNTKQILGFRVGIHTFVKEVENLIAD
jgi:hypothetical protein